MFYFLAANAHFFTMWQKGTVLLSVAIAIALHAVKAEPAICIVQTFL